jgi:hypothetical protein
MQSAQPLPFPTSTLRLRRSARISAHIPLLYVFKELPTGDTSAVHSLSCRSEVCLFSIIIYSSHTYECRGITSYRYNMAVHSLSCPPEVCLFSIIYSSHTYECCAFSLAFSLGCVNSPINSNWNRFHGCSTATRAYSSYKLRSGRFNIITSTSFVL